MEELFSRIENHCVKHLEEIAADLDKKDGFVCYQQIDDLKDIVSVIRDIHKISAYANARKGI